MLVNPALIARADENSALSFFADVLRLSGAVGLGLEVPITPRMLVQHSLRPSKTFFKSFGMLAQSVVLDECETYARYALSVLNSENDIHF